MAPHRHLLVFAKDWYLRLDLLVTFLHCYPQGTILLANVSFRIAQCYLSIPLLLFKATFLFDRFCRWRHPCPLQLLNGMSCRSVNYETPLGCRPQSLLQFLLRLSNNHSELGSTSQRVNDELFSVTSFSRSGHQSTRVRPVPTAQG